MTNHDIEVSIKYCRDCQEVLGDRTSSWLFADIDRANAWMLKELGACIKWLVSGRGCKVSIRKYQRRLIITPKVSITKYNGA